MDTQIATMTEKRESNTRVIFDLADILDPEEIEQFLQAAEEVGVTPTEHLINLTLRRKEVA